MNTATVLKKCLHCGTTNRIPVSRLEERPSCGRCTSPLFSVDTTIIRPQTIPGTRFPFPVIPRKGPPALHTEGEKKQRRGLLAKIHVAKQHMRLTDGEYEMILRSLNVSTAADLTIPQLENMIKLLKHYGWKPARNPHARRESPLPALRRRCVEAAAKIENGERRLAGLAQRICGTAQLAWCRDAKHLERLLAVLGSIVKEESNGRS